MGESVWTIANGKGWVAWKVGGEVAPQMGEANAKGRGVRDSWGGDTACPYRERV